MEVFGLQIVCPGEVKVCNLSLYDNGCVRVIFIFPCDPVPLLWRFFEFFNDPDADIECALDSGVKIELCSTRRPPLG